MTKLDKFILGTGSKNFNKSVLEEYLRLGGKDFDLSSIYWGSKIFSDYIKTYEYRNQLNIHFKLWIDELGNYRNNCFTDYANDIRNKCKKIIKDLNITQITTLIIHWPLKINNDTKLSEEFIPEELWIHMEKMVEEGLVKHIGVSNFGLIELHRILDNCKIKPYSNQIEVNPFNNNCIVKDFCIKNNIKVIAHSPFSFGWKDGHLELFKNDIINYYSIIYNTIPVKIIIDWLIKMNVYIIIGTSNIVHLNECLDQIDVLTMSDVNDIIIKCNKKVPLYTSLYNLHNLYNDHYYSFNDFEVMVGDENYNMFQIKVSDTDFLNKCKKSLTEGPGYLIIKKLYSTQYISNLPVPPTTKTVSKWNRWDGIGSNTDNILNISSEYTQIITNILTNMIIESLLGWDCLLDNCSYTTSRCGIHANQFGPHQDSPFEHHFGCKLPPYNYPIVIQSICLVDDFTENNGAFFLIPGSHKNQKKIDLPQGIFPINAKKILGESGDVVLCLGNIYHGACKNETNNDRKAFLYEFVSSIIEPRDRFNETVLNNEIIEQMPARMIRLLYGGRERYHLPQTLKHKWEKLMINKKTIIEKSI